MLKITGYSDKYSAHPGEEIKFYINAENIEDSDGSPVGRIKIYL